MPRARTQAIAGYFQKRHPVSAGNALDTLHAVGLLYCDLFLTGDHAFHAALQDLLPWVPAAGRPVLLDAQRSIAEQLEVGLTFGD